jgi:uroporphyrin-III C-methyltransferase
MTHRDYASGVTLVTGHPKTGGGPGPNWRALAAGDTTLVIYMGLSHLAAICDQLLAAGMRPDMPAAVIASGTLPEQREVIARLANLSAEVAQAQLASPAIVVIGEVVRLARGAQTAREAVDAALRIA